jgi:ribose 5-phosphate isomerase A
MNPTGSPADPEARFKKEAAERAVQFVQSGMKVGLGTGSTAAFATRRIAALLKTGELLREKIVAQVSAREVIVVGPQGIQWRRRKP